MSLRGCVEKGQERCCIQLLDRATRQSCAASIFDPSHLNICSQRCTIKSSAGGGIDIPLHTIKNITLCTPPLRYRRDCFQNSEGIEPSSTLVTGLERTEILGTLAENKIGKLGLEGALCSTTITASETKTKNCEACRAEAMLLIMSWQNRRELAGSTFLFSPFPRCVSIPALIFSPIC